MERSDQQATPNKANRNQDQAKRVGLYGGSFDPVHCGHIELANRCIDQANLDEVIFIPAARSPLKKHNPFASDEDRFRMLKIARKGSSKLKVSRFELDKGGVSFSVETASTFQSESKESELYWILGADQFAQLGSWHRIEELSQIVTFLAFSRSGYELAAGHLQFPIKFCHIEAPLFHESSSDIRKKRREGDSIANLVPSEVEAFISQHDLYS